MTLSNDERENSNVAEIYKMVQNKAAYHVLHSEPAVFKKNCKLEL